MATRDAKFIRWMQRQLNAHGFNLKVDGIAGPRTRAAMRAFQERMGIDATGTATEDTVAALRQPQAPPPMPRMRPPMGWSAKIRQMMMERGASGPGLEEYMTDFDRLQAQPRGVLAPDAGAQAPPQGVLSIPQMGLQPPPVDPRDAEMREMIMRQLLQGLGGGAR